MKLFPPKTKRLFPYDFYWFMRKNCPVAYDEENDLYGLYRYTDVYNCLTNFVDFSSNFSKWYNDNYNDRLDTEKKIPHLFASNLKTTDPPRHRRMRNVISDIFHKKQISKMESKIERVTQDLIEKSLKKNHMDLIQDIAYPLPIKIICHILGIPEEDHYKFNKWADQIINSHITIKNDSIEDYKNNYRLQQEIENYFNSIIDFKKNNTNDLIGKLVRNSYLNQCKYDLSENNFKNKRTLDSGTFILTQKDILSYCTLLVIAGHITTVNLIGNTFLSLFENIDEFDLLKSTPSNYLDSTIEESLRYRPPVQAISRYVTKDIELGLEDKRIKISKGKRIFLFIGSANHDETVFPIARKFDICRSPNKHLAFGLGIHLCIGAPLARLEAKIALKTILNSFREIQPIKDVHLLDPIESVIIHGVKSLPISVSLK